MKNGTIQRLQLHAAHASISVLAQFIELTQGDALDCAAPGGLSAGQSWVSAYALARCPTPSYVCFTAGDTCAIASTGSELVFARLRYQVTGYGASASATEDNLSLSTATGTVFLNRLWGLVGAGEHRSQTSVLACTHFMSLAQDNQMHGDSGSNALIVVLDSDKTLRIWNLSSAACQTQVSLRSLVENAFADDILCAEDAILSPFCNIYEASTRSVRGSMGGTQIYCGLGRTSSGQSIWRILRINLDNQLACTSAEFLDFSDVINDNGAVLLAMQPLHASTHEGSGPQTCLATQWMVDGCRSVHVMTQGDKNSLVSAPQVERRHVMHMEDDLLAQVMRAESVWDDGGLSAQAIQASRTLRLFAPDRFSVRQVLATLTCDMPGSTTIVRNAILPSTAATAAVLVGSQCSEWARQLALEQEDDLLIGDEMDILNVQGRQGELSAYGESLDAILLDLTRRCHLRDCREITRSARSSYLAYDSAQWQTSAFVTAFARADKLCLVLKTTEDGRNHMSDLSTIRAHVLSEIREALDPKTIAEFWLGLELQLHKSAVADAGLLAWITQRLENLSMSCWHLSPFLQERLGAVAYNAPFFDQLLIVPGQPRLPGAGQSLGSSDGGVDFADQGRNATKEPNPSSGYQASLAFSLACTVFSDQSDEALLVAVLVSLMTSPAAQSGRSLWTRYHVPAALDVMYAGLLRWLALVRQHDMTDVRRIVDMVQDQSCPNSHELSTPARRSLLSGREKANQSTLRGIYSYYHTTTSFPFQSQNTAWAFDARLVACRCAYAARASLTGPLVCFLASESQFLTLRKVSSFLLLRLEVHRETMAGGTLPEDEEDHIGARAANELADVLLTSRARTLVAVSEFFCSIHAIMRAEVQGRAPSVSQHEAVRLAVDALLLAAPNRKIAIASDAWAGVMVPAPTGHQFDRAHGTTAASTGKKFQFREDLHAWRASMLSALGASGFSEGHNGSALASAMEADAICCCADTLAQVVTENEALLALVHLHMGVHPTEKLSHMLVEYASYLQHIAAVSHTKDTLELVKRARALLGAQRGSEVCLQVAYGGLEAAKLALESCADFLDAHDWIKDYHFDDYRTAWTRVLNFALEGRRLDEALTAVCQLLELEWEPDASTDIVSGTTGSIRPWELSLRSVVALACESGNLHWLCTIPETVVRGISIVDRIAATLQRLSESRSLLPLLNGESTVNYHECLFAFYLHRKSYRQAASALYGMYSRLTAETQDKQLSRAAIHASACMKVQALAGAVSALAAAPATQAFLLVPAVGDAASAAETNSELVVVTNAQLLVDFLLQTANVQYLQGTECADALEAIQALSALTNMGPALLATTLALHLQRLMRSTHPLLLDARHDDTAVSAALSHAVRALALNSALEARKLNTERGDANVVDPTDPVEAPTMWEPFCVSSSAAEIDPYALLRHTLCLLDGAENNHTLYLAAVDALLKNEPTDSTPVSLLMSLHQKKALPSEGDASKSAAMHSQVSFEAGEDVGALIRTLLRHGRVTDACRTATLALDAAYDSTKRRNTIYVPYTLLDRVVLTARHLLSPTVFRAQNADDEKDLFDLRAALTTLESRLEAHFITQCSE